MRRGRAGQAGPPHANLGYARRSGPARSFAESGGRRWISIEAVSCIADEAS